MVAALPGRAGGPAESGLTDPAAPPVPVDTWIPAPATSVPGQHRFTDGQKVRHAVFGEGQVVSSRLTRDDEEVTVAFPEQGIKKLMASLAKLDVMGQEG